MLKSIVLSFFLVVAASLLTGPPAQAVEPLRAYTSSTLTPLSRGPDHELPGFFHEYVSAVLEEADLDLQITYVPWRRAQTVVAEGSGHLLFGATRTADREPRYRWVTRLITTERAFLTTGAQIDTLEAARGLARIGARSVHAQSLEAKGFTNLDPGVGNSGFEKLAKGRVDAVYTATVRARFVWETELGLRPEDLVIGAPIEGTDIWLAASPDFDLALIRRIDAASQRLIANGTYARLHKRYFGNLDIAAPSNPAQRPSG